MLRTVLCIFAAWVVEVACNGRLLEPPGRSSLWRFPDDPAIKPYMSVVVENDKDDQQNCGGLQYQETMEGKCGICGDRWDDLRENEAGGKYGQGIIVRQYEPGSVMDITVQLTHHRLGFFEFRLCDWNEPEIPAYHDCFNEHLLELVEGGTRFYPPASGEGPWNFDVEAILPDGLTCSQCILQWRYQAGNLWGCESDEECCLGCGLQEESYGCADVAIGTDPVLPPPQWNQNAPPPTSTEQNDVVTSSPATGTTTATTATAEAGPTCQEGVAGTYKLDCTSYYICTTTGVIYTYNCPPGTVYDEFRQLCDHDFNVPPVCGIKAPG